MATTPSTSLIANLRAELMRTAPFAQMEPVHVDRFIAASQQAYYAPGETLLAPADGVVPHLMLLRQGRVTARRGTDEAAAGTLYEAGDLFPVGAVMGDRAVAATYRAGADSFCLLLPVAQVRALAAESAPFADFLNRRVLRYLDESRRALQASYAAQALAEQSLETPLATLMRRSPVGVDAATPLALALQRMHEQRIGSLLVFDAHGAAVGIFTRHDVLERVTLAQLPLATPIAQVMSAPVRTLLATDTAQDAALLMSRHGIRHVPVTEGGRVVGIVSERDLFALQRLSIRQLSSALRSAPDVATLQDLGGEIRRLARNLLGQGVRARQLTELISHLNDLLTERLVVLIATERGIDLGRACWLAFGSEGRSEQTISTDQDNGLVFESDDAERDRPAWLAFGRAVNDALAACGYPLCKGGVMAGNPACCLTAAEWSARINAWMEHGAPEHLLQASIYFDLRPLAGRLELATPLRALITRGGGAAAALHAADGTERVDAPAAAELAGRHRDLGRWRSRDARPQAAGHGGVRRRGAAVCARARRAGDRHARPLRGSGARDRHRAAGGRGLERRLRVPAAAAPAGAARRRRARSEPRRRRRAQRHRPPHAPGEPAHRAPPAAAHRAGLPALRA